MNTALATPTMQRVAAPTDARPSMLVLQPSGPLTQDTLSEFQAELEQSLELATDTVVLDMLWVNQTDDAGIHTLVASLQKAEIMGKVLSIQALHPSMRIALRQAWQQQQDAEMGEWNTVINQNLEKFLNQLSSLQYQSA